MKPHYLKDTIIKTFNELFKNVLISNTHFGFTNHKGKTFFFQNDYENRNSNFITQIKQSEVGNIPGVFTKAKSDDLTKQYIWHENNNCVHIQNALPQQALTRLKLPVIKPFTFKINIHELSKIGFEICECITDTLPSSFKFDNVSSYKTLLTVENNDFINNLKDFFYVFLDEKKMEHIYKRRQLHSPASLFEEQLMFNSLGRQEEFLEKTINEYTEKFQSLPVRFETHKENINYFLTEIKRSKENQRRYLKASEQKLSKEYIQNYYLNGCKYYNKSIHSDETLILCHLTWYKKPHKVFDVKGNIVEEIHYFETVKNTDFIEAFNEANNNAYTYIEASLYQDLMKVYTHTIIKSEHHEQRNEMLILLPAEIYQALMKLSFEKNQVSETMPGVSTPKINAAYNFEITKESFQDEAFKETLTSLVKDNKMNFTEIAKTAWNLQK